VSFDSIAPIYGTLEKLVFGRTLQRARTAFIEDLDDCSSVLIAGEGDGRFVAALLAANVQIEVDCIEQSARMIQLARRRIGDSARVQFINSDIARTTLARRYDAIVTNFFLDCFNDAELPRAVEKLANDARPKAKWLIADFTTAPRGKLLVAAMYAFFRLTTRISARRLISHVPLLEQQGFRCSKRREFFGGIVRAELWQRGILP
jgi:SAM-dependent methyltransferase